MQDLFNLVAGKLQTWLESAVLMLPNLVAAVLIVVAGWVAARLVGSLITRTLQRVTSTAYVARLLAGAVKVGVITTAIFVALGVLQLDKTVTSLVAGAGVLTLVIGLAFQELASNFVAGVLLQIRNPFRVGQLVKTGEHYGIVDHVNLRATVLRTPTGQVVVVPNKDVFQSPLVNFSQVGQRRVDVPVGVSYGTNLDQAQRVAAEAVAGIAGRDAARPVEVFYEGFGDSAINFTLRFWIGFEREVDYLEARSQAVKRIKAAFDEGGITIPFPIRTLDFSRVGGRTLAEEWPAGDASGSR